MDAVSYSLASKQAQRIEKFIENPDSMSGIVTVPKTIASGETITIPAGRIAVLPNVQVDGVINIEGEVFVPSGSTYGNRVMYEKLNYVATQGQTVFAANYDLGSVDVFVNGIRLANTDFVATSLTSVTITGGVNAGDIVELVSFGAFTVANTYTKAETDNNLSFKANTADLKEIGVGQTWQVVTASRAINSSYTNTTGKPIIVFVVCTINNTSSDTTLDVDGVVASFTEGVSAGLYNYQLNAIVPNGSTYKVTTTTATKLLWHELR